MMPLAGRRILITRARHQARALSTALESQGAEVLAIPTIEIVPPDSYDALDRALRSADQYQWLVLTSVNGVEALVRRMEHVARTSVGPLASTFDPSGSIRVAAMGPATARALESHGLTVDLVPERYVAESLVEALQGQVFHQKVLLVRAKTARDVLPLELERAGASVDVVDAYQTVVPEASCAALRQALDRSEGSERPDPGGIADAITFTSSSTVTNWFHLMHESGIPGWPARMAAASIGPITSRTLLEHGIEPVVEATEYTIPGLVAALCRWYRRG